MRRSRALVATVLTVFGTTLASSCAGEGESSPDQPRSSESSIDQVGQIEHIDGPHAPPHCGGSQTILDAEASRQADHLVLVPDSSLASEATLEGVYRCPSGATLMEFPSGMLIYLTRSTSTADPGTRWSNVAATSPDMYSVATVHGVPALLADPFKQPEEWAEGGVILVIDGTYVAVLGDGEIALDDLVAAAETLREAES